MADEDQASPASSHSQHVCHQHSGSPVCLRTRTANAYYPQSNRGPGLVASTTFIDIAADMANGLLQEFVFRKVTPSAKNRH
jgi:hypothetical protein